MVQQQVPVFQASLFRAPAPPRSQAPTARFVQPADQAAPVRPRSVRGSEHGSASSVGSSSGGRDYIGKNKKDFIVYWLRNLLKGSGSVICDLCNYRVQTLQQLNEHRDKQFCKKIQRAHIRRAVEQANVEVAERNIEQQEQQLDEQQPQQ